MNIMHCVAADCGRPFQVNRFSTDSPLSAHRGRITCPHCGRVEMGHGDWIFLTHALSREEERQWEIDQAIAFAPEKKKA